MTKEQELLVLNNLKLVRWFCYKFHFDYEEYNDVLYESLVKAALNYNVLTGMQFSSYAIAAMKNDAIKQLQLAERCKPSGTVSLDSNLNTQSEETSTMLEVVESREQKVDSFLSETVTFMEWFNKQTPRNKQIMVLFGRGHNGTEVAKSVGISRQRVNVIKQNLFDSYMTYRKAFSR